jgi:hypothetical protein
MSVFAAAFHVTESRQFCHGCFSLMEIIKLLQIYKILGGPMALTDFYNNFHLFMRWFHVLFGIIWVGHLFFFNFVNIQLQATLDDATKKVVNPQLIPRALWWFRWSAMGTFLSGWVLFTLVYMYQPTLWGPTAFFTNTEGVTGRAWWILIGMILGSLMWFNVWFVIWPAQKSLFGLGVPKAPAELVPTLRSRSALFFPHQYISFRSHAVRDVGGGPLQRHQCPHFSGL